MAKDALGHGSDARGAEGPNTVKQTFSSTKGVGVHGKGMYATLGSGAMVKLNAAATGGRIPGVGTDIDPAQHTMVRPSGAGDSHLNEQGHEWGSPAALKDFTDKYGGPRDHAAEQRGFNRGTREINRLKRQGK